jgi:hypothetical protein
MPQKPSFPPHPQLAPARVPAAHVQAAAVRSAQAKMPAATALRPVAPHVQSALAQPAQAKATVGTAGPFRGRGPAPHVQAALGHAAQAKLPDAPSRPGSSVPVRPTLRPVRSNGAIQLSSAAEEEETKLSDKDKDKGKDKEKDKEKEKDKDKDKDKKAITLSGQWKKTDYTDSVKGATFKQEATVEIFGIEYQLIIKGSAQKHSGLETPTAVVDELNARSSDFSEALTSKDSVGTVRLASGDPNLSIKFEVSGKKITIFHAQKTKDKPASTGQADASTSWRRKDCGKS